MIINIFRINDEEIPVFDENQETWMTMSNQIVICLYGVTPSLALVCVMREGKFSKKYSV